MASYTLFLELAKVIGATRMMELCELYIARNKYKIDASGSRVWWDCSGDYVVSDEVPCAPKKEKQVFQSPLHAPLSDNSLTRRLSFSSVDDTTPLPAPASSALCHTMNSNGDYSMFSGSS